MASSTDLLGKRILICQPIMHACVGSTVCTIELAEYLVSRGGVVDVYTTTFSSSIKKECKKRDINVFVFREKPNLSLYDYDYIWVHSEILPISIINELDKISSDNKKLPFFIFAHLSALDEIPDESPWNCGLEDGLADMELYVSDATKEKQAGTVNLDIPSLTFRNPVPPRYVRENCKQSRKLKKVLIVSNHVPPEVWEAKKILEDNSIVVDHLGAGGISRLISPDDIFSHDVVITIGKTVQYSLLANTPVYIYDHFGGPGYLNKRNYKTAKQRNFSGRGFSKKTGKQIAKEVLEEFADALDRQNRAVGDDKNEFRLDVFWDKLDNSLERRPKQAFSSPNTKAFARAQYLCAQRFEVQKLFDETVRQNWELVDKIRALEDENRTLSAQYERVRGVKGAFRNLLVASKNWTKKIAEKGDKKQ